MFFFGIASFLFSAPLGSLFISMWCVITTADLIGGKEEGRATAKGLTGRGCWWERNNTRLFHFSSLCRVFFSSTLLPTCCADRWSKSWLQILKERVLRVDSTPWPCQRNQERPSAAKRLLWERRRLIGRRKGRPISSLAHSSLGPHLSDGVKYFQ